MRSATSGKGIAPVIATLLGIGYLPLAPGTAGTLAALAVYLLLPETLFTDFFPGLLSLALFSLIAVFLTDLAEKQMTRDDKRIVLDEFLGFFFAVFFLPKNLVLVIIAFILFRVLDIFKPFPINSLQKLKGGWGIMADDLLAGVLTNICLQIVIRIFPDLLKFIK